MTRSHALLDSPVGTLTLVEEEGSLVSLWMDDQRHRPPRAGDGERDDRVLPGLQEQLLAYFAGELEAFDVPLRTPGTEFQQRVWSALRRIPYGQTRTYGELAREIGAPAASRAVGLANGRNPVGIVVPCHRVIGAGGRLIGYGGGLERKRWLLDHESRAALLPL